MGKLETFLWALLLNNFVLVVAVFFSLANHFRHLVHERVSQILAGCRKKNIVLRVLTLIIEPTNTKRKIALSCIILQIYAAHWASAFDGQHKSCKDWCVDVNKGQDDADTLDTYCMRTCTAAEDVWILVFVLRAFSIGPFWTALGLIFFDCVILEFIFETILASFTGKCDIQVELSDELSDLAVPFTQEQKKHMRHLQDELWDDIEAVQRDDDLCDSVYMDLTKQFERVFPVFLAQVGFLLFYVVDLNTEHNTHYGNASFYKWALAIIATTYCGESQLGEEYSKAFWTNVMKDDIKKEDDEELPQFWQRKFIGNNKLGSLISLNLHFKMRYYLEWRLRQMMDFFINSLCRTILMYTFPILMCTSDDFMDFVKDAMAIYFITTLDDIQDEDDKVPIYKMMNKLRVRQEFDEDPQQYTQRHSGNHRVHAELRDLKLNIECTKDHPADLKNLGSCWSRLEFLLQVSAHDRGVMQEILQLKSKCLEQGRLSM